jgi:Serine/threonine protein kinase
MVGKIVGNYKIIGKIGSGGMGRVYKAVHLTLDRVVAMKMIHPNFVSDTESVNRFYKEAKIQAQLSHPNIVTVYDFLGFDGNYFIIMEYVHGESVGRIVAERGHFEPKVALAVFNQILNGIKYAHLKGIIHRDVKPSNFILTTVAVKITDFGIARIMDDMGLKTPGGVVGTPKYMSPEQILGEKTDHRTDIYSLGVAFYEMLTGRVPFSSDTNSDYEIKRGHIELPPLPPTKVVSGIPKKLEGTVLKALSKKPEERFQSVDEFIASLENIRVRKRKATINKDVPLNLDNVRIAKSDNSEESTIRTEKEEFDEGGDLHTTPYPALLISLYREKKTGFLLLDSQMKIKIYFIEGFVAFVEGEEPRLALGEMLVDRSKINESDREEALNFAHDTGLKIGEALIQKWVK